MQSHDLHMHMTHNYPIILLSDPCSTQYYSWVSYYTKCCKSLNKDAADCSTHHYVDVCICWGCVLYVVCMHMCIEIASYIYLLQYHDPYIGMYFKPTSVDRSLTCTLALTQVFSQCSTLNFCAHILGLLQQLYYVVAQWNHNKITHL